MLIIVDGYNVLKQAKGPQASAGEKEALVKRIAQYGRQKHEIIIVFDGGHLFYPTKEDKAGVVIVYAGMYQSADDYIKKLIEKEKDREILLASSDNELCSFAYERGMASIDALAFFHVIQPVKKQKKMSSRFTQLKKFDSSSKDEELDALMAEETRNVPLKNESLTSRARNNKKISKHEKKILKKIKKL